MSKPSNYELYLMLDVPMYYGYFDPANLHTDFAHYQRRIDWDHVKEYAGAAVIRHVMDVIGLVAVRPDDTIWLVDGQHHSFAAYMDKVTAARYMFFRSTGWEQEAEIFNQFQELKKEHHG